MEKHVLRLLDRIRRQPFCLSLAVLSSGLLLSACGTAPLTAPSTTAAAPAAMPSGEGVAATALHGPAEPLTSLKAETSISLPGAPDAKTATPPASAASDAAATDDDDEGKEAAGTPTDPLRPEATLNLGEATATQDLWDRIRQGYELPELNSTLVADHERWYRSRPDYVQRMTERASRYLFHVVDEIERRQMPTELALLPFIESAFNPQAKSAAAASGIWQFMPATGRHFELTQNMFRDDRRDVLASTRAALDYLQRLYKQFGDWHLALAAYNWGEGNLQRAIDRNAKRGLPTDYLSLNLPPETRNYVPKLYAVRNIVAHPEAYGLTLTPIENHPYFVSVPIQRDMDVDLAARLAGLPLDEFKALNPSLNKPVIIAAGTPQVLLPYDNANLFVHNLNDHHGPLASWTAWVVPKTMRPADLAKQVGMSESALRELNRIPPRMLVRAGSTLVVPRSGKRQQDVSEALAENAMMALAPDRPATRKLSLRAGKRDSVASIARRYRVSAQQVALWNGTRSTASFKRGQTVVVYVPVSRSHSAKTAVASKSSSARRSSRVASASNSRSSNVHRVRSKAPSTAVRGKVRVASAR